jgi:hypothetical protein
LETDPRGSGRTNILEYLVEEGADVNEGTNDEKGGSPLWWAEHASAW